jgi:hypothetical protein
VRFLYKLYHPEIFQGSKEKKNYFEGWYFKVVNSDGSNALAIIPGVSIGREEEDHAFVQVLDGNKAKAYYYHFPIETFQADAKLLHVRIGNNIFSKGEIILDLPEFTGSIKMNNHHPIPVSTFSPGIMGWYSFTPFMQCYHGVISMYHQLNGELKCFGKTANFDDGIGYLEKDWGTSFPKCWIWSHCNHFDYDSPVSLMASVAHIPWMGSYFIGFIVAFLFENKVHIFATYNNSRMKVKVENEEAILSFKKKNKILSLKCIPGPGADLKSPIKGLMKGRVNESLQASLRVKYQNGKQEIDLQGQHGGLEIAGEIDILLSDKWRK